MIKLSVNINKIATLRNSRGGNVPNLIKAAKDCESFGAHGITVHPRPDERHIKYRDVYDLKNVVETEFNIEGYPTDRFINLITEILPTQVTLVPDAPDALTSNSGWDTIKNKSFLVDIIKEFKDKGVRTSLFIDPVSEMVEGAYYAGAERIELYTEMYARDYNKNRELAIESYVKAARVAVSYGLGINAGHDLNLENLKYFAQNIPELKEVSIGHAIICDSIYYGIDNTIRMYLNCLTI